MPAPPLPSPTKRLRARPEQPPVERLSPARRGAAAASRKQGARTPKQRPSKAPRTPDRSQETPRSRRARLDDEKARRAAVTRSGRDAEKLRIKRDEDARAQGRGNAVAGRGDRGTGPEEGRGRAAARRCEAGQEARAAGRRRRVVLRVLRRVRGHVRGRAVARRALRVTRTTHGRDCGRSDVRRVRLSCVRSRPRRTSASSCARRRRLLLC